jgi:hypothetical protein
VLLVLGFSLSFSPSLPNLLPLSLSHSLTIFPSPQPPAATTIATTSHTIQWLVVAMEKLCEREGEGEGGEIWERGKMKV